MVIDPQFVDVLRARRFLEGKVRHTPLERSFALSEIAGRDVYLKWENQQLCGSFKIRGALNKMYSLTKEEAARGVVTSSSGNHGQGVAMAALQLGIRTVIVVPGCCPETKKIAIKRLGGPFVTLKVVGTIFDDAEAEAHRLAEEEGMTFISAFEDPYVIAGAGTAGLEMFLDEPDIDCVVIPAGGGGLSNGIAIAAKACNPNVQLWGVQSEASNPWIVSWPLGKVVDVEIKDSLADGLAGGIPQSLLDLAKKRMTGYIEITERDIADAIAFLLFEHHQVVEGSGAVGVAALLRGKVPLEGRKKIAIVISGGNIDKDKLHQVLEGRW